MNSGDACYGDCDFLVLSDANEMRVVYNVSNMVAVSR